MLKRLPLKRSLIVVVAVALGAAVIEQVARRSIESNAESSDVGEGDDADAVASEPRLPLVERARLAVEAEVIQEARAQPEFETIVLDRVLLRVVDGSRPVAGAVVGLFEYRLFEVANAQPRSTHTSDHSGHVQFSACASDRYSVVVHYGGCRFEFNDIRPGPLRQLDVGSLASIHVQVVDHRGFGVQQAEVVAVAPQGTLFSKGDTDAHGTCVLPAARLGNYNRLCRDSRSKKPMSSDR